MSLRGLLGQSAIEYLMTYGWMLVVLSITGSAVFAVVSDQSTGSVSGFSGGDVVVDNFGLTGDGNLQLSFRNTGSEPVVLNNINISNEGSWTQWIGVLEIPVGESETVELANVTRVETANTLDADVRYDSGLLEDLDVSGELTGSFEITESGSSIEMTPDPVTASILEVSQK